MPLHFENFVLLEREKDREPQASPPSLISGSSSLKLEDLLHSAFVLVGEIIGSLEKKGFSLKGLKFVSVEQAFAEKHYADLSAKPFFNCLVEYIIPGPVVAMVWEGKNVVTTGRKIIGATNPSNSAPGTIRGDFTVDIGRRIYVGAVPKDTTQDTFYKHFKKYGKIKCTVISGVGNHILGFGFITYADPSVVDKIIRELHIINGEKVEITRTIAESNDFNKNGRRVCDLFKAMEKMKSWKKDEAVPMDVCQAMGTSSASGVLNRTIKGRPMKKSKNVRRMKTIMEELSNMTLKDW